MHLYSNLFGDNNMVLSFLQFLKITGLKLILMEVMIELAADLTQCNTFSHNVYYVLKTESHTISILVKFSLNNFCLVPMHLGRS
jgi:hypothetical protein